ncbi:hypothetical protein Q5P01_003033 [Channa striata]|uniref:Ig-like domain-containing protein n=1 Tax=Channa striata TaxID=64152 RepID=A0AA88NQF3_CHASR|nr:hypothetical protein Q5P01_003033 [Channa striata]
MASSAGASVAVCYLWVFVLTSAGGTILLLIDQQQITVKTGDDVTLQCANPRVGDIELLVWTRPNLEKDVFVWKHGKMSEDDQHESFKNRVELKDSQMKDGNVSVILKNVTINDTGTYECRVRNSSTSGPPQSITNIHLTVTDSGQRAGRTEDGGDKGGGDKDGGNKGREDKEGVKTARILTIHWIDNDVILIVAAAAAVGGFAGGGVAILVFLMFQRCKWKIKKNSDVTTFPADTNYVLKNDHVCSLVEQEQSSHIENQ